MQVWMTLLLVVQLLAALTMIGLVLVQHVVPPYLPHAPALWIPRAAPKRLSRVFAAFGLSSRHGLAAVWAYWRALLLRPRLHPNAGQLLAEPTLLFEGLTLRLHLAIEHVDHPCDQDK